MNKVAPESLKRPLIVPPKLLMGPGPSNCSQRVLEAMSKPILGQLHKETLQIMSEVKEGIKWVFQTQNEATMCISASGHGGMEASLCNLVEDGDVVLIGITGIWGQRAAEMARRYGGDVHVIESKPGAVIDPNEIEEAIIIYKPSVLFMVQGDSSTGILQPIQPIGQICRNHDCLLIVDTVASLGGVDFYADAWHVDVAYTGSQKVLSAPPGITPITFNARAMDKINKRRTKVKVWYWDATALGDYWGCFGKPIVYHHTISAPLLYALREALAIISSEGLGNVARRHMDASYRFQRGIEALGLQMFVGVPQNRLATVNAVKVPPGTDWKAVLDYAMQNYSMEIGGGLGPTVGQIFRVGLMGINATPANVDLVLKVLEEAIPPRAIRRQIKPKL